MTSTLKWILGIVLVLVVAGGLFFGGMLVANHGIFPAMMTDGYGWQHPMLSQRGFDRNLGPMMGERGYTPFGRIPFVFLPLMFFGGLLRLAIPLGILALVGYFMYEQGKKAGMKSAANTPPETPPVG